MSLRLLFPLAQVLDLANQAVTDPRGAYLLLVADDGVYLMPGAQPPLDQPGTARARALYAQGYGPGSDWQDQLYEGGTGDDLAEEIALLEPAEQPLIDQLRRRAANGHDTLTVIIVFGQLTVITCRTGSAD